MNLFPNPTYNDKFIGNSSAKPIAGVCTLTAYKRPLIQAKASADGLLQGDPVTIKNTGSYGKKEFSAGQGLAPLTMAAEKATTAISGFVVESPNNVYIDGNAAGQFFKNQIINVAPVGSGAEMYLPVKDGSFEGVDISNTEIHWVVADNHLDVGAGDGSTKLAIKGATVLSQVVEGIQFYIDAGVVKQKTTPVIKIKL